MPPENQRKIRFGRQKLYLTFLLAIFCEVIPKAAFDPEPIIEF